jgi:hypothetical protein
MLQVSKTVRGALLAACAAALLTGSAITAGHASDISVDDQVGLPHKVMEDAAAYQRFVTEAGAVNAKFADGNAVRRALKTGAGWEAHQLQSGEVAYAALLAMQDPRFVEAVRAIGQDRNPDEIAARILRDPNAVLELPGAQEAASRAATVLGAQGQHVYDTGAAVKQSAYTIQHQAWSRGMITDRPQRLAQIKSLSDTRVTSTAEEMKRLVTVLGEGQPRSGDDYGERRAYPSPVVTHGVALAALAVLGRARDVDAQALETLTSDSSSGECLKLAKLNLFQCLAVAGPRYEDVFCLGEHGLKETGQCLTKAATRPGQSASPRRSEYQQTGDHYDPSEWPRR